MNTKHWRIAGNAITDLNGNVLLLASHASGKRDAAENLNLAGAAPEMLAALEQASLFLHGLGSGWGGNEGALRLCHDLQPVIMRAKHGI